MPPTRPYDSQRWRQLRKRIIERDKGCVVCGATEQLDVDHIQSWETGGAWYDPANLRTLCRTHHNRKATRGQGRTPTPTRARPRNRTQSAHGVVRANRVTREW